VHIVAAENFWGDIAAQLGGTHVKVTSIIKDPSADPHLYESNASDAAAIANADLVIENGAGYDDSIAKLLSNSSNGKRRTVTVANVLDVTGDGANPHLWYDVPRVPEVARAITMSLKELDGADASAFDANLATFEKSLAPLTAAINEIKTKHPNAPVAYTERVPEYLLRAAGLAIKTPAGFAQAIEDGDEPNARDAQAMNDLMTTHQVDVLLYNSQATSPATAHVQDLARGARIAVVGVTETIPKGEPTYQRWQLDQIRALLAALGG
jgi:zinc/manganese transport system substrate-binding protein